MLGDALLTVGCWPSLRPRPHSSSLWTSPARVERRWDTALPRRLLRVPGKVQENSRFCFALSEANLRVETDQPSIQNSERRAHCRIRGRLAQYWIGVEKVEQAYFR